MGIELNEIFSLLISTFGPYGLAIATCYYVMKKQDDNNKKLLDFMLQQIDKQATLLEELRDTITETKEYMALIKQDLKDLKEKGEKES